ncbi:zinc finger CCCH domain-containing protein 18 [Malaya genurostris]|uniref:zinc finger CCCH domain-containing protein 18 n=1 Tax=Malaya genurostris TaxID=325434 RepID=UPI0026F387A9|nr:zinc finger CCCH domain-containing protein 18 [Malaya genurostris]XP_058466417.1 zinc finger CCCH domain-containing protein 18 [Malaya genurostris]
MKKIRRWQLVFAVIIALMVRVDGLKATSLIFGRGPATSSTSTTSTTPAATSTSTSTTTTTEEASEEEESDDQGEVAATKAPLTGIPQVDYVWDPNLPRELGGYNLSTYPFLDSVPAEEDIGFTCDPKLHDGFYASIKYNCQLYHHCIHGIRYDFLCANYTAFDQKTFICHFASEVDCKNSPKYWFRNEPLYKATTTTTQKPAPTTPTTPAPTAVPSRQKPLRKPVRRRRPQVDYYYEDEEYDDDYYEERPRRRKNRPRNRRPTYDDEYEDDERFDRRPADRYRERDRDPPVEEDDYDDRRPYRPKNRNRNNDRRNEDEDRRYGYDDRRRDRDRRPIEDDRRRPLDEDRRLAMEEEKRSTPNERRRRPIPADERRVSDRRPIADEYRPVNEDRRSFAEDDRRKIPEERAGGRRPYNEDRRLEYEEEDEDFNSRRPEKRQKPLNDVVTVKPSGSTIYDRPRAAPKINRPVPLNEKNKYSYTNPEAPKKKPTTTTASSNEPEPEYYDEYEDEPKKPEPVVDMPKTVDPGNRGTYTYKEDKRQSASSDVVYYDDVIVPKESLPQKPIPGNVKKPDGIERINTRDNSELTNRYNEKIRSPQRVSKPEFEDEPPRNSKPEYVDDEPAERSKSRPQSVFNNFKNKKPPISLENRKPAPVQSNRDLEAVNKSPEVSRPILRATKRPFLPSRGGNPYAARGLQPVGVAKQVASQPQRPAPTSNDAERPAPFRIDVDSSPPSSIQLDMRTSTTRPNEERVKTLDQLYDEEFDVTLNDALNPTLKPLTRSAPHNFFRNRYQGVDPAFVPFEPSYAPSEFRRAAVRPPPAMIAHHHQHHPTVYVSQIRGHPAQRYEYEYEY